MMEATKALGLIGLATMAGACSLHASVPSFGDDVGRPSVVLGPETGAPDESALDVPAGMSRSPDPRAYSVHLSPDWTPAGATAAMAALADWEGHVGVTFTVTVTADPCPPRSPRSLPTMGFEACFVLAPATLSGLQEYCGDDPSLLGCTSYDGGTVQVLASLDDGWKQQVTEHEVGHALGLRHVTDTGAVMYPNANLAAPHLGYLDVEQFAVLRSGEEACGIDGLWWPCDQAH